MVGWVEIHRGKFDLDKLAPLYYEPQWKSQRRNSWLRRHSHRNEYFVALQRLKCQRLEITDQTMLRDIWAKLHGISFSLTLAEAYEFKNRYLNCIDSCYRQKAVAE